VQVSGESERAGTKRDADGHVQRGGERTFSSHSLVPYVHGEDYGGGEVGRRTPHRSQGGRRRGSGEPREDEASDEIKRTRHDCRSDPTTFGVHVRDRWSPVK